ncbi:unnamed protein product [Vitrella brassicaformis CCMP3155]|uniref:HTH La-type RNA-binding domain-containing protein n=2 Tax=Vitrella brassicaformis TaxID=1169539 RepID=A0A0G4FKC8_VITBC|nr:unnamed protein product [Vitrella brassicaformis CCMP3155]|eukprot:CEM14172.1 unnamed protein product [Vitrella brassicaformis CCMP3155]
MAANEGPEVNVEANVTDEKDEGKRAADAPAEDEPADKKAKLDDGTAAPKVSVNMGEVRRQVEYYLSDQNLRQDKFFHEKISSANDGWLDMKLILECPRMKLLKATKENVLEALKGSHLEIKDNETGCAVRRLTPLPTLVPRSERKQKNEPGNVRYSAHLGGVVLSIKDIPEEVSWNAVRDRLGDRVKPQGGKVEFATQVKTENSESVLLCSPFDGDVDFLDGLKIDLAGRECEAKVLYGDALKKGIKDIPPHLIKKREKAAMKRRQAQGQGKGGGQISLAGQSFGSVNKLRNRLKGVIASHPDNKPMNKDSSDYKLVVALLDYHPRADEKKKEMTGIKVDVKDFDGQKSRCFHVIRTDGTSEDFSYTKCMSEYERRLKEDTPAAAAAAAALPADAKPGDTNANNPAAANADAEEEGENGKNGQDDNGRGAD